jgi:hypothetical protein
MRKRALGVGHFLPSNLWWHHFPDTLLLAEETASCTLNLRKNFAYKDCLLSDRNMFVIDMLCKIVTSSFDILDQSDLRKKF